MKTPHAVPIVSVKQNPDLYFYKSLITTINQDLTGFCDTDQEFANG